MSTQTQPPAPEDGEPTVVVDDYKATTLAALAWSDAEDYPDDADPFDDSDRTTFWLRLSVATAAAVVVVLGVTRCYVLSQRAEPEPTAAPAVPASSTAVAAPVPPGPDDKIVPSTTVEAVPAPPPVIAEPPR